jgi:hypothetical protein
MYLTTILELQVLYLVLLAIPELHNGIYFIISVFFNKVKMFNMFYNVQTTSSAFVDFKK